MPAYQHFPPSRGVGRLCGVVMNTKYVLALSMGLFMAATSAWAFQEEKPAAPDASASSAPAAAVGTQDSAANPVRGRHASQYSWPWQPRHPAQDGFRLELLYGANEGKPAEAEPANPAATPEQEDLTIRGTTRGYGMANLDHGIPNTPDTAFHVASVSKQFTAASSVLLAQESKLSLDDPVRKYLPEVPDLGATITLRQLVHHISGLRDQWDLLELSGWRYSRDRITDEDVMRLITRQRKRTSSPARSTLLEYGLHAVRADGSTRQRTIASRVHDRAHVQPARHGQRHFRDDHAEIVPGLAYGYERDGECSRPA